MQSHPKRQRRNRVHNVPVRVAPAGSTSMRDRRSGGSQWTEKITLDPPQLRANRKYSCLAIVAILGNRRTGSKDFLKDSSRVAIYPCILSLQTLPALAGGPEFSPRPSIVPCKNKDSALPNDCASCRWNLLQEWRKWYHNKSLGVLLQQRTCLPLIRR